MAGSLLGNEPIPGELFWTAPDSELRQVLDAALELVERTPAIVARIEADQDAVALAKKRLRQADARWWAAQTLPFPELTGPEPSDPATRILPLEQGRPRMAAEVVYVFFVLQGYLGSVTDLRARDQLRESRSLQLYLQRQGLRFPGATTILENVNALSVDTRNFILDAQLAMIREDELDDFSTLIADSTASRANSAWPTDGRLLVGLLERAYRASQRLSTFGLPNLPRHWVPRWLRQMRRLLYLINTAAGKAHAARKRKKYYRKLLAEAQKILEHLLLQCFEHDPLAEVRLPPSQELLLRRLWDGLTDDLIEASAVHHYTYERVFEDQQRPAKEKLLSLGDPSAAYIEKGGRDAVIGYKPQFGRSGHGFVSGLLVTEGNPADSTQLTPLVEQVRQRTEVQPQEVTADDGYAAAALRELLLAEGVQQVIFCGAKGKACTPEAEWDSEDHQEARRGRSAVESLVFVLKYLFGFGQLRRRGLEAVGAELLQKALAYNFYRMVLLRSRAQAAEPKAA